MAKKKDEGEKTPVRQSALEWYSGALGVLSPLRWHLNELVDSLETINRLKVALGETPMFQHKVEAAREACDAADRFLCTGTVSQSAVYPVCQQCGLGNLVEVRNERVEEGDDDVPESMRNLRLFFTGAKCEHCGRRPYGLFQNVEVS